jgi:hypothetical protein
VELYFSTKGAARRWGERALSVMSVERDVDSPNTPKRVIEQAKVRTPPEPSERERERERGGSCVATTGGIPKQLVVVDQAEQRCCGN